MKPAKPDSEVTSGVARGVASSVASSVAISVAVESRGGLRWRFSLLCMAVWLHATDTLVTATVAPAIVDELGGVAYINWTIALYEVGAIIAGAAAGVMSVRFGLKRVLVAAAVVYGLGCLLAALAPTMGQLLAARLVQGLGGGLLLSLCYLAIHAWFPEPRWTRMFSIIAVVWGAGSLLGPLIGAAFAGPRSWHGVFWLFGAQAVALALASAVFLPRTRVAPVAGQRWPVLPLIVLSAATLVIAQAGLASNGALALITGLLGAALLYAAARLDRRSPARMLPPQLLSADHPLGAGLRMVFALSAGCTGFWAYGPLLIKILFDTKPLISGYILAGEALAWSLGSMAVSRVSSAADRPLIRSGVLSIALGAAGFAVAVPSGSLTGMVVCTLLQGVGFGICWPAIVHRTVRFADPADQALASAAAATVQRIGYAVGTAAAGIAANLSGLAEGVSMTAAKAAGFWVFAAFIPLLAMGLASAWKFTADHATEPRTR